MLYVIDAYNLIGHIHKISLSDPKKEQQLVDFLKKRGVRPKDKFLLVFDGKRDSMPYGHKEKQPPFTLCFTPLGQSADTYIAEYLESQKVRTGVHVVSSDWEVRRAARANRFTHQKSETFLRDYRLPEIPEDPADDKPSARPSDVDYWLEEFG